MSRVAKETRLMADEAKSWNDLHAHYAMERIDHRQSYSLPGGIYTNVAEKFFSRMRRAEIGNHHHIAGAYLVGYAQESAWHEDHPSSGGQWAAGSERMGLAMACRPFVDWCGYWQRVAR